MVELPRRRSVAQALALDLLTRQVMTWREAQQHAGATWSRVVDVGGGTGGLAAHLAGLGFGVTVIDPSPDALASLQRRAAEAGLGDRLSGRQGDASDLPDLVGAGGADLVLCHRVLDVVDDPAEVLASIGVVLRAGGALSLLVAQRHAAVWSQALAGHIRQALHTWQEAARFSFSEVAALVEGSGFRIVEAHGIGAIADHVPEALVQADVQTSRDLAALDRAVSQDPAFRALAPVLHLFAVHAGP